MDGDKTSNFGEQFRPDSEKPLAYLDLHGILETICELKGANDPFKTGRPKSFETCSFYNSCSLDIIMLHFSGT